MATVDLNNVQKTYAGNVHAVKGVSIAIERDSLSAVMVLGVEIGDD